MKTAIIYARVSSLRQAQDELPIAGQIDQARAKAVAIGATVLKEFIDDGISGRSVRRPAFQAALAFCEAHRVTHFIVWNTARFGRNKIDAGLLKRRLRAGGTSLVYVTTNIDPETDEGWLSESVLEIMDEAYSRSVSKDTRRGMMKNAVDGNFNGGRVPFGYRVAAAGKRRRVEVNEDEAPIVRKIFEHCLSGSGCKTIAMQLNSEGVSKRGARWTKANVSLVLKNYRSAGLCVFNRRNHAEHAWRDPADWITVEGQPAIVELETFERAQALLEVRAPGPGKSSPHSTFAFTGLMQCSKCGSRMKIETATGRSATYSYYNCSGHIAGRGCAGQRVPARPFDEWMLEELAARLFTPLEVAKIVRQIHELSGSWVKERRARRELLVRELRQAESRRDRLFEILELEGRAAPNLGDIAQRLRGHKARIAELEGRLVEVETAPELALSELDVAEVSEFLRATVVECESAERRRSFFGGFVEALEVRPTEVVVTYHPDRMLNRPRQEAVHSERNWLPERALLRTKLVLQFPPALARRAA